MTTTLLFTSCLLGQQIAPSFSTRDPSSSLRLLTAVLGTLSPFAALQRFCLLSEGLLPRK